MFAGIMDRSKSLFVLGPVLAVIGVALCLPGHPSTQGNLHDALVDWLDREESRRLTEKRREREMFRALLDSVVDDIARGDVGLVEGTDAMVEYVLNRYPVYLIGLRFNPEVPLRERMARGLLFEVLDRHSLVDAHLDALVRECEGLCTARDLAAPRFRGSPLYDQTVLEQ